MPILVAGLRTALRPSSLTPPDKLVRQNTSLSCSDKVDNTLLSKTTEGTKTTKNAMKMKMKRMTMMTMITTIFADGAKGPKDEADGKHNLGEFILRGDRYSPLS